LRKRSTFFAQKYFGGGGAAAQTPNKPHFLNFLSHISS
jgi:hypothetical protein